MTLYETDSALEDVLVFKGAVSGDARRSAASGPSGWASCRAEPIDTQAGGGRGRQ
jgi:hypothetical protein